MTSETKIKNKIIAYLKQIGCWYYKAPGTVFGRNGVPDILCCYRGKFIAIEVKSEKGITSKLQNYELRKILESGGHTIVAFDLEDVINLFANFESATQQEM